MLIFILCTVVLAVVVLLVVAAMQPTEFRVTRSTTIAASPAEVFPCVSHLRQWENWSPWIKLDPAATQTYSGPSDGVGAAYAWAGNNQVGQGAMTIVESRPHELVRLRLDFLKPFKATNSVEFTFQPEDAQTVVTWSMSGENNLLRKVLGLFLNCEKMCGGFFEKGLADMKSVAEGSRVAVPSGASLAA